MSRDLSSLFCTVVIALTLTFLTTVVSEPTPSPNDKCVSIRLDDSQRIYLTGSGQKGAVGTRGLPGKIGPKGDKGEKGFRGRVGPEGKKGSKGNDSGITELERRLVVAEQMIAELQNVTDLFRKPCSATTFESCKAALENRCSANGVYYLKPATVSMPFRAFCDQATDQGGWMLQYAYKRNAGDHSPLVRKLPIDLDGYSHQHLNALGIANGWAKEVRFYCSTSYHNRIVHFKTSNLNVLRQAYEGGGPTSVSDWTSGTTKLIGHTAYLPDETDWVGGRSVDGFVNWPPFFKSGHYYFNIREGSWSDCDNDHRAGLDNTIHRVFVRN